MEQPTHESLSSALADFRRARNQAFIKEIVSRFTGEPVELLAYEDVRKKLITLGSAERGLEDIPLSAIVGSVGRYTDFTRDFLPLQDSDQHRWARVKVATSGLIGLPPIDVYKIGGAYFVKDGNHRVSVARQLGAEFIQAYVTDVQTRVPLTPEATPDDLIWMSEYAEFLEHTGLDNLRPEADLRVSIPGQYSAIKKHIASLQEQIGQKQEREISYPEAVMLWYDTVYLPVVQAIRELGILRRFPGRTETDLYVWVTEHREELEQKLGWKIEPGQAAVNLAHQQQDDMPPLVTRLSERILDVLSQGRLEAGPPPGRWREEKTSQPRLETLFRDILVGVNGEESGWIALEQAAQLARRENSRVLGLHVVGDPDEKFSRRAIQIREEFQHRATELKISGSLAIVSGDIARQIADHATLADLVVTPLVHPPPTGALARLDHGFRTLIEHSSRPLLAVPQTISELQHAILAFDGSPKAQEALFVATYLAGTWKIPLTVVTVFESDKVAPETLMAAQVYLEDHQVQAQFAAEKGPVAEAILRTVRASQADFIIMGGYGLTPVMEVVLGSTVDRVLRETDKPVLICR